jgi:hypothetical protein
MGKSRLFVLLEAIAVAAITGAGTGLADWGVTILADPNAAIDPRRIGLVAAVGAIGGVVALFRNKPTVKKEGDGDSIASDGKE